MAKPSAGRSKAPSPLPRPSHVADGWRFDWVFDELMEVNSIEARGGMVVAVGGKIHRLGPGDKEWKVRTPIEGPGSIIDAVAVEPRGARRHAIAPLSPSPYICVVAEGDALLRPMHLPRSKRWPWTTIVSRLAWGGVEGPSVLWVLTHYGMLRLKPDLSGFEPLDVETVNGLASDETGVVAMATREGGEQRVHVTRDGMKLASRTMNDEMPANARMQLAVADTSVVVVVDWAYVLSSRTLEAPFARIEVGQVARKGGWKFGPVAFEGTSSDAALFCCRWSGREAGILRVDPSGATTSILEFAATETHVAPSFVSVSWDVSRQMLWGALRDVGIFTFVPPGAKGKE